MEELYLLADAKNMVYTIIDNRLRKKVKFSRHLVCVPKLEESQREFDKMGYRYLPSVVVAK